MLSQYIAFTNLTLKSKQKKYALYFLIQGVLIYSTEEKVRNEVTEYEISVTAQ